jgi:2-succinyl-5-enolpyruvyl-6-hydroxy-3-cyclohexene-1-carboxylate synthase
MLLRTFFARILSPFRASGFLGVHTWFKIRTRIRFASFTFSSSCLQMSLPFPAAVIQAVLNAGVQEFVVCAGARNSALIVVLAALGDKVRLWQHFDERAAGFFAIGRIRATERPVAVVTTSGTAAAELLPAMIEAHYQGLPLVAVTADRPKHYRGSGAPQAIEQAHLYQCYATGFDFDSPDDLDQPGFSFSPEWDGLQPLHINACLDEPNANELPRLRAMTETHLAGIGDLLVPDASTVVPPAQRLPAPLTQRLVIAGELLESQLSKIVPLIREAAAPIFAEAASGLRDLPELQDRLLRCGDATLRHLPVSEVWRFGGVPSARWWRDLEHLPDIHVHSFSRSGHSGLARVNEASDFNGFPPLPDAVSAGPLLARDSQLYARLGDLLMRFPNSEPAIFRRLSQFIPHRATVLTGNSLAIREWNLCAEYGRGHRVHVLRGANGIDGNLSAFLGVAADAREAWCVTGDLTALYDLNAPWMLRQLPAGRRRFVVIQNSGGKIFSRLPSLRGLTDRERALMENPHTISLRGWAKMWGMDHAFGGPEVLESAGSLTDHAVIEVHPDPAETEAFWNAWAEAEQEAWA